MTSATHRIAATAKSTGPSSRVDVENGASGVAARDVMSALGRHKLLVFGLPLLLMAGALAYSFVSKPGYTSTAQVFVDPRDRTLPRETPVSNLPGDGILLVESQLKLITSDEVLSRVAQKLNLKDDPAFSKPSGLLSPLRALLGMKSDTDPALATLRTLRLNTSAKRMDRSFVLDVSATAQTPEKAVLIANSVAETYLESLADAEAGFNKKTSDAINARLEDLRQAVQKSENEVEAFRSANGLVGARTKMVTEQQLDEVNTQLTAAKTKMADARSKVQQLDQVRQAGGNLSALPEAVQSATIAQLRAQSATVTRDEALLSEQYGPSHPALIAAKAQRRDIEAAINAELARIGQSARNEAARAQSNVQSLQANFDALKAQQVTNDKAMVPLRELERKAEANRGIYEAFLAKAKAAQESQGLDTNNARLISRATPPEQKSWPPTGILVGAGLFGGLALGIALALLRDVMSRPPMGAAAQGISAADENVPNQNLAEEVGFTVPRQPVHFEEGSATVQLAHAPSMAMSASAHLTELTQHVLASPPGHVSALVRMGEAAPHEMAVALAEQVHARGKVVLLIDADGFERGITTRFGFEDRPGLQDVINGDVSIYDAARYHRASQLNIVPAGSFDTRVSHGEAGEILVQAIGAARDFDAVIIDAGHIDSLHDYALLAMADETLLIAPEAAFGDSAITKALQRLEQGGVKARAIFVGTDQSVAA